MERSSKSHAEDVVSRHHPLPFPKRGLYAVTDPTLVADRDPAALVAAAIRGGAVAVQYRDKDSDAASRRRIAIALRRVCHAVSVPFIVNDDAALAAEIQADGVHVGREDRPCSEVRRLLGEGTIVGVSCNDSIERAIAAEQEGADYVAFGRFFPSYTKPHAVQSPIDLLARARPRLSLPVVAIGGITPANGARLLAAGADVLAVIHSVFGAPDPESAAASFRPLFR